MKTNEGNFDRIIRLIGGLAIFSLLFILEGGVKYIGLIGLLPITTALVGWCPLYSLLGINTLSKGRK